MSIIDPIIVTFFEKYQEWGLLQGRETFFGEDRKMLTWSTEEAAAEWARANYPYCQVLTPSEVSKKYKQARS